MRLKARAIFAICAFLFAGVACEERACTDDYNPVSRSSCSYNPELGGLADTRDANAEQLIVPEELGGGHVYLLVSPRRVPTGELPDLTIVNRSDVTIGFGSSFRLYRQIRHPRNLMKGCVFTLELRLLDPGEEAEIPEIGPCANQQQMKPGSYAVNKDLILDPGGAEERRRVTTPFEVVLPEE